MATVGEYLTSVTMRGINDGVGLENTVNAFMVTPQYGLLELKEGNPGLKGDTGPAAFPWKWQGDVTDLAALDALAAGFGFQQAGWAFRVVSTNEVRYWDGTGWIPFLDAFGALGRRGAPNVLTIGTVTTGPEGSEVVATITGDAPNQVLNLTIPRGGPGEQGDPGGPGPIRNAPDYDNTVTHLQDFVPAWDTATDKFRPIPYPAWRGPWALAEANFNSGSNISTIPKTIATINIPAQPAPWRPFCMGGVQVWSHVQSLGESRVDVEVRIGSIDGQIVALGPGFPAANQVFCRIQPYFGTDMNPASTEGIVPANQTVTLYVVIRRPLGTRNYSHTNQGASLIVWAQPVYAPDPPA